MQQHIRRSAIFKATKNPEGAKALVDWWLSKDGKQAVVQGWMHSVRGDVEPPKGAPALKTFSDKAIKVNWEKLSKENAQIKEAFRVQSASSLEQLPADHL